MNIVRGINKKSFFYTCCKVIVACGFVVSVYAQQAGQQGVATVLPPLPQQNTNNADLQRLPSGTAVANAPMVPAIPSVSDSPPPPAVTSASVMAEAQAASGAPSDALTSDPAAVQAARDQAFDQLTLTTLPMTPAQIQKLRDLFANSQRAATVAPGGAPPKPVASTQLVSLSPGSTPPIIRLSQGYVTSVVFLDSSGAPWPIQSYDNGNPGAFNIQWDHTSNIMMIQSSAMYTTANLVVQLKGLNTPISISLIPGQPLVDYRIDLRVQGLGPNAKPGVRDPLPQAANNNLINVLDGMSPDSKAKVLSIPGSTSLAWLLGDKMYIRTTLNLLSPAWIASMTSADGTNAYEIPKAPSILVSDNDGKIFNLRVEGY